MMFRNLLRIRDFERQTLPFMCSLEDREILLAIGNAEEGGAPLSLKELILSLNELGIHGLGSPSTLRRRLDRLLKSSIIEKRIAHHDGRVVRLYLTRKTHRLFNRYELLLSGLQWKRTKRKNPPPTMKAKNSLDLLNTLVSACQSFGPVSEAFLSCSPRSPGQAIGFVQMPNGHANQAANALGGRLFGYHSVFVNIPLESNFDCPRRTPEQPLEGECQDCRWQPERP